MPQAKVVRNEPAGTDLRWLTLDITPEGHDAPGQFVTVHLEGHKPAYFALASSPGQPAELLIKTAGDTAALLGKMVPGDAIEISDPIGHGFPLDRVKGRELVVLVNGSGISAARPVIAAEVAAGLPRPVHLYYGVLTPDRRSFLADLEAWGNAGVQVHTVVDPRTVGVGWTGATGFVQEVAREHGLVRDDVAVVLVGLPIMIEQAKAMWAEAGLDEECLLTNF